MKRFFTAVTPGTPHFTFAGLRPVPAEIASTRDCLSEELGAAAAEATGYRRWTNWTLAFWGTNQDAIDASELLREPKKFCCVFDTETYHPRAFYDELARQFPRLLARVFAISCDGGVVGDIRGGAYTEAAVSRSFKLAHLVYDAPPHVGFPKLSPMEEWHAAIARGWRVEAAKYGIVSSDVAEAAVLEAWAEAHSEFGADGRALIEFANDADGYGGWFNDYVAPGHVPTLEEAEEALDEGFVADPANLVFFLREKRTATGVDRSILAAAAVDLDPRHKGSPPSLAGLHTEDELREWAMLAMLRGQKLDMSDVASLEAAAERARKQLATEILEHVRSSLNEAQELKAA